MGALYTPPKPPKTTKKKRKEKVFKNYRAVTVISTESEINEPGSNSGLVCCVHIRTNATGEEMNTFLPAPIRYGLNSMID